MSGERSWKLPSGTEVSTNVEGSYPMGAEAMVASMIAAGLMTEAEGAAALERRRKRLALTAAASLTGAPS